MAEPTSDANGNMSIVREMAMTLPSHIEAVAEFYDKWSAQYDEDVDDERYGIQATCAAALSKLMPDKSALIVDCAAGTGKVGRELAKQGFTRIDAVDMSKKSLEISVSRGVYERLICDILGAHKIKGVTDGYYSGLICVSAIGMGHVPVEAFTEWNRILKKGGFMVFTIGRDPVHDEHQRAVYEMFQQGVWELINVAEVEYFYCKNNANMFTIRRV